MLVLAAAILAALATAAGAQADPVWPPF